MMRRLEMLGITLGFILVLGVATFGAQVETPVKNGETMDIQKLYTQVFERSKGLTYSYNKAKVLIRLANNYIAQKENDKAAALIKSAKAEADKINHADALLYINANRTSSQKEVQSQELSSVAMALRCEVYQEIATAYSNIGKLDQAMQVMQLITKDPNFNLAKNGQASSLEQLATNLADNGQLDDAFQITKLIGDEQSKCNILISIMTNYQKIEKDHPNPQLLTEMIREVQSFQNDWYRLECNIALVGKDYLEKNYDLLLQKVALIDDPYQRVMVLSLCLISEDGQIKLTDAPPAFLAQIELAALAIEDGDKRLEMITGLAKIYYSGNEPEKAAELMKKAAQTVAIIQDPQEQLRLSLKLVDFYLELDQNEKAMSLLEADVSQIKTFPDQQQVAYLTQLIPYFDKVEQTDRSAELQNEALALVKSKDGGNLKIENQIALARILIEDNQKESAFNFLAEAFEAAKGIADPTEKTKLLEKITKVYCNAGAFHEAFPVVAAIGDSGEKATKLEQVIQDLMKTGDSKYIFQLLPEALPVAASITDSSKRAAAIAKIIGRYMDDGQFDKALSLAKDQKTVYDRSVVLETIVAKYLELKKVDEAITTTLLIPNDYRQAMVLTSIANSLAKDGQLDKAHQLLQLALSEANKSADIFSRSERTAEIAKSYAAMGDYNNALQNAKAIENPDYRRKALLAICSDMGDDELYERALSSSLLIGDNSQEFIIIQKVIRGFMKKGYYSQALQLADRLSDDYSRTQALLEIIQIDDK